MMETPFFVTLHYLDMIDVSSDYYTFNEHEDICKLLHVVLKSSGFDDI